MALRLVVLISGTGSLLLSLLRAESEGRLNAHIVAVGADRDAKGLDEPRKRGIATFTVKPQDFPDRAAWDDALAVTVGKFSPDLVVSAGFMRILGEGFLQFYGGKTINTHPALLPNFPGAHAVRDALAAGAQQTGCTVHWVDAGVDTGPVIAQRSINIEPGDTEDELHERIKAIERELLVDVVNDLCPLDEGADSR